MHEQQLANHFSFDSDHARQLVLIEVFFAIKLGEDNYTSHLFMQVIGNY